MGISIFWLAMASNANHGVGDGQRAHHQYFAGNHHPEVTGHELSGLVKNGFWYESDLDDRDGTCNEYSGLHSFRWNSTDKTILHTTNSFLWFHYSPSLQLLETQGTRPSLPLAKYPIQFLRSGRLNNKSSSFCLMHVLLRLTQNLCVLAHPISRRPRSYHRVPNHTKMANQIQHLTEQTR